MTLLLAPRGDLIGVPAAASIRDLPGASNCEAARSGGLRGLDLCLYSTQQVRLWPSLQPLNAIGLPPG